MNYRHNVLDGFLPQGPPHRVDYCRWTPTLSPALLTFSMVDTARLPHEDGFPGPIQLRSNAEAELSRGKRSPTVALRQSHLPGKLYPEGAEGLRREECGR